MPTSKRTLLLITTSAAALLLAACGTAGGGGDDAGSADSDHVIGVSLVTTTRGFHSELYDGMKAAAKEHGVELIATDAAEDVVQQLDDVDSLLSQGVEGIIIVPVDEEGSVPAYESADVAGVPMISAARDANTDLKASFVGAKWESYGKEIAEWTCARTDGSAKVAMIKGPSGASFVNEMSTGYNNYVADECPGMEIVFEANAETDGAQPGLALAQDAVSAQSDLDVIYVNADDTAMGVLQALEEQNRIDDVIVTGFNGEPDAFEAIAEGRMEMTYALKPYTWGKLSLETMLKHLDGENLPDLVPIETVLVDQDNIKQLNEEELR